jgi:RsiW-degrading membrane proteinase PrsW (M82 family)
MTRIIQMGSLSVLLPIGFFMTGNNHHVLALIFFIGAILSLFVLLFRNSSMLEKAFEREKQDKKIEEGGDKA